MVFSIPATIPIEGRRIEMGIRLAMAAACLLASAFALAGGAADGAPPDLIVASCLEQGALKPPCLIFNINTTTGTVEQVGEVEAGDGIRMVKLCEEERKLAVWRYTKRRDEVDPDGEGSVSIVSLDDRPTQVMEVPIPFEPVLGGFFFRDPAAGPGVITEGIKDSNPVISYWRDGQSKEVAGHDVPWENVLLYGTTPSRGLRQEALAIQVNPETGKFARLLGPNVWPMDFGFDEQALARFNRITDFGKLSRGGSEFPYDGAITINDKSLMAVGIAVRLPQDDVRPASKALFNKDQRAWTWFDIPRSRQDEKPSSKFSSLARIGQWIVMQRFSERPQRWAPLPASRCLFIDLGWQIAGEWDAPEDTEILAIAGNWLAFRREDSIFLASFNRGQVGTERLLCKGEAFHDVHWALFSKETQ
jgi:hypothetical protein